MCVCIGVSKILSARPSAGVYCTSIYLHFYHRPVWLLVVKMSLTVHAPNVVSPWDIVAIVVYFTAVLCLGFYSMCRSNRGTVSGYFLAGRFMTWLPVGASLFASNIGSEHFIGLAGSGAASGFGVGAFELGAAAILQLLGWVMLPVYIASGAHTLPEYMKKRFGGSRIRVYLACLSLILYIFTKVSVNMYSGALFIRLFFGWNIYWGILLVLAMTGICTVTGGLAAVIYMETLQCALMVFGASFVCIFSFIHVGGYTGLMEKYWRAIPNNTDIYNQTCGLPSKDSFRVLRGPTDTYMPWPGFLLGQTGASIWYWAADQMMVQRVLSAKSISHAQGGTIMAGYIKLLPFFVMVMPGMISRALFPDEVACATQSTCKAVCDNEAGCSNIAFPKLVLTMMPAGMKGIMFAVMLAALMSDLSSIFNSSATLFTIDIYHRIRKNANAREMLIVGRLFVLVMIVLAVLWVPVVSNQQGGQLFIYIQAVSAYLAPPIAAVYLLAILWKRCNETGAFFGLMGGLVVGIIRMVLDFVYPEPACGIVDTRPSIVAAVHYMYFAMGLFWLTSVSAIVLSLLTKPPEPFQLIRTTYWTRKDHSSRPDDEHEMVVLRKQAENQGELAKQTIQRQASVEGTGRKIKRLLLSGYSWFCGYDNKQSSEANLQEFENHLHKISTLEQKKWEKGILAINSIILVCAVVILFIFFSVYSPILAERYKPDWLKSLQQ